MKINSTRVVGVLLTLCLVAPIVSVAAGTAKSPTYALVANTPLWFYCLREAEFNNCKLGGVGSRIVAETFHRAMQGAKFSIVRDTAFRPHLGPNNTTFRMVDLLLFAFDGKKNLLAPTGD